MRKVLYFLPAILFAAFYGLVSIGTGLFVSPVPVVWIVLFVISGVLWKEQFWGGLFELLPGCPPDVHEYGGHEADYEY